MTNSVLAHYTSLFSNWQVNVVGPKPTAELFEKVHGLGLRPGLQALACAMSLRADGVTGKQIVIACGAQQLNRMRGLVAEGMFKWHAVPRNGEGHTVYKHTVTPKGDAEIKRIAKVTANATASTKAPAKAAKPAAKVAKVSRKANAAKAATPEAAKVTAPVEVKASTGVMPELPESLKRKPEAQAAATK